MQGHFGTARRSPDSECGFSCMVQSDCQTVFEQGVGVDEVNKVLRVRLHPLLEDDGDVLFALEGLLKHRGRDDVADDRL